MKYRFLWFVLALACLAGCAAAPVETQAPTTTAPTGAETTLPPETTQSPETTVPETTPPPITVSPLAVEDFLLPLEEFSWERQFDPEFVMIHFTSAVVAHRDDPFNMEYIRDTFITYDISIHYIIQRDGTVRCYIPEDRVAWHAGAGEFLDDPKYTNHMNQYAIGIELVAIGSQEDMSLYLTSREYQALDDSWKGFTEEQYQALSALVEELCQRYEIPRDEAHVIGHQAYSPSKNDPGALFDWSRILPSPEN